MEAIVVGIDESERSLVALDWAAAEAASRGARLVVVHAWHVPASAYGIAGAYGAIPALYPAGEIYERSARDAMRRALARIDADIEIDERVVNGDPATAIADAAAETDASMIVLGDRRRSALGELLVGSTGRDVARRATVPIVVVPAADLAAAA